MLPVSRKNSVLQSLDYNLVNPLLIDNKVESQKRKIPDFKTELPPTKLRKLDNPNIKRELFSELKTKIELPTKWCSLKLKNGKIRISTSKKISKLKNLIYVFHNKQNGRLLIGKTGSTFTGRMSVYASAFNGNNKMDVEGSFLSDVKRNPSFFEVGVLYLLNPGEDLNEKETFYIDEMSCEYDLYNQRRGGAGGLARSEEIISEYAVPKENLSPKKYYPIRLQNKGDENAIIRPDFSPTFHRTVSRIDIHQGMGYIFKNLQTGQKYIGATGQENKTSRIVDHCRKSEVFCQLTKKYSPETVDGAFHPALGQNPTHFGVNALPIIYNVSEIPPEELHRYHITRTLGETETTAIKVAKSLKKHNGYNCRLGGGGPISDIKKKSIKAVR